MYDMLRRMEPATRARLDLLPRWDNSSVRALRESQALVEIPPPAPDPRVTRTDVILPRGGDGPGIPVRWYRPRGSDPRPPCLVFFHGGGYVLGSVDANDDRLDQLAIAIGCTIVSVDWRLAPEHPYPEGLEDADEVLRHLRANGEALDIDERRIAVGGASAGAGLAAALCLRLRAESAAQPVLQLLIYPMIDDRETDSMRGMTESPEHPGLWHIDAQRLCWKAYLSALDGDVPVTAAPSRAVELSGLAPAFIGVGDIDPFLDEDVDYARRLSAAGVPTDLHVYPGVIHGGLGARPDTPNTRRFLADVHSALRRAFEL